MERWLVVLVMVVVVGGWGAFQALQSWRRQRARRHWEALGAALELSLDDRGGVLTGRHRGLVVEVSLPGRSDAGVRMGVDAPLPEGFALIPRARAARRRPDPATVDVKVGDFLLDEAFQFRGVHADAVVPWMRDASVQAALKVFVERKGELQLTGGQLFVPLWEQPSEDSYRDLMQDLWRVASALRDHGGAGPLESPGRSGIRRSVEVRKEFGRRWSDHNFRVGVGGVMGVVLAGFVWRFVDASPEPELLGLAVLAAVLGAMGAALANGFSMQHQLRCPACEKDLRYVELTPETTNEDGKPQLSLDRCPHCEARLR
jgi:hypothetical protein